MLTTVIADSIGSGLQPLVNDYAEMGKVEVLSYNGTGFGDAVSRASVRIKETHPDLVIPT